MEVWFKNFLMDRWQWVVANGEKSFPTKLRSRAPQGLILGLLLFLLIIEAFGDQDLDILLTSLVDDSEINYRIDTIEDALYLQ